MWARVATFEGANEDAMREMSMERERSGEMEMPPGVVWAQAWSNHEGQTKFVTYFENRDDIQAAEATFEKMGDEIPEDVRGRRTSVEVWEIVWQTQTG
jgi:hypothetical protein